MQSFSLVKWYFDCVTVDGDVTIVYCAELRWRSVQASYSSIMTTHEGHLSTRTSLSRAEVNSHPHRITVDLPRFGLHGAWEAASPSCERLVFEQGKGQGAGRGDGSVRWNCLQPSSTVSLRIGDRALTGLGYAECLTLTIPPWNLPLTQLRWGRFVSPQDSLAWVDWQGPFTTSFALHNGRQQAPVSVSSQQVVLPGASLQIEAGLVLRSGNLGSTVFPEIVKLTKLLPRSLFQIQEHKWRSRGVISEPDHSSTGWVIHEVVQWGA